MLRGSAKLDRHGAVRHAIGMLCFAVIADVDGETFLIEAFRSEAAAEALRESEQRRVGDDADVYVSIVPRSAIAKAGRSVTE